MHVHKDTFERLRKTSNLLPSIGQMNYSTNRPNPQAHWSLSERLYQRQPKILGVSGHRKDTLMSRRQGDRNRMIAINVAGNLFKKNSAKRKPQTPTKAGDCKRRFPTIHDSELNQLHPNP